MLRNVSISRKSFIASAIALCTLTASPKQSKADPLDVDFSSPEDYIEAINESGAGWTTYALDANGEMYVVTQFEYLAINDQECETQGVGQWVVKIAVYIGKALKGYVEGLVIDGIIKQITGKSGDYWVSYAANQLLGRPVPAGNVYRLPCSVYPPNSGEYVRCING